MKKKIIIAVFVVAGAGIGYWLISPLFITHQVNESLADIAIEQGMGISEGEGGKQTPQLVSLAQGTFIGLAGHEGAGTATLVKAGEVYYIRFEEDFRTTNGPDVYVYLGRNDTYDADTKLGPLKGNIGSQNYEIPAAIDIKKYNEVWVWCRTFSVPFAKAELDTN